MATENANKARASGQTIAVQKPDRGVAKRAPVGKKKLKEALAYLIEDALERSEVVIAAESIVEKLQSMAEDLSSIEAKDIMPLFDALTNAFGPQVAQKFNSVATEQIRQLVGGVQSAKSALDSEILRLKQGVEGGDITDMGMDDAATPMMPSVEPGAPEDPLGGGLSDTPPANADNGGDGELGIPGGAGPAVGRQRKESAIPKGKPIRRVSEDVDVPRSHESINFGNNLSNLSLFHGGAGRLAQSIANMIRTDELSEVQRKGLASVLSHLAAFASEPAHWSGVDADKKLEMALQSAGIWKIDSPALQKIVPQLKRLTHVLAAKHDGMLESNIRMLRTASNPDALILHTFRTKLKENRDGQMAAIRTARTFAIDIEDVVAVVKEAAARRPFREAPEYSQQGQTSGQPDDDLTQGIPMFPVEQGAAAAPGGGTIPAAPNATAVQPNLSQPPNQSNSTNKPLSPADMRLRQSQQQAQAAAPQGQPAPSATAQQPNRQAMPTQPQPASAQRQAAPAANPNATAEPALNLPGQVIDPANPALKRAATR